MRAYDNELAKLRAQRDFRAENDRIEENRIAEERRIFEANYTRYIPSEEEIALKEQAEKERVSDDDETWYGSHNRPDNAGT